MNAPPLRAKTTAIRRQHILETAITVFSEKGFRRTTMKDIARAGGIAEGTIYNVFDSKHALLLGLFEPFAGEADAQRTKPKDRSGTDDILQAAVAERWASFTPSTLAMLRVVLAEALVDPDLRALFVARILTPVLSGSGPLLDALPETVANEGCEAQTAARLATALFLGLVVLRLLGEEGIEREADAVPGHVSALLTHGLRVQTRPDAKRES